jgi:predicted alpha/beta-fold hydrolase
VADVTGKIVRGDFVAAPWLRGRHAQTIFPSLPGVPVPAPRLRRELLELPDGDITAVDWLAGDFDAGAPVLTILHGLEGSSDSTYARMLLAEAARRGWRAGVLHFRDCGNQRNRLPRRYHAGDTADLRFLLGLLSAQLPGNTPLLAAGYSLGGNVLLKYLGESGDRTPLSAAVAVSVPLDLRVSAESISTGFSKYYETYLLKRMKTSVASKFNPDTAAFNWRRVMDSASFMEFDDAITAPLHGFVDKDDYYDRCSAGAFLNRVTRPTLVIQATDDPFMAERGIPDESRLASPVTIELSPQGGHVGFIHGGSPWRPRFYLPERITVFLAEAAGIRA